MASAAKAVRRRYRLVSRPHQRRNKTVRRRQAVGNPENSPVYAVTAPKKQAGAVRALALPIRQCQEKSLLYPAVEKAS